MRSHVVGVMYREEFWLWLRHAFHKELRAILVEELVAIDLYSVEGSDGRNEGAKNGGEANGPHGIDRK